MYIQYRFCQLFHHILILITGYCHPCHAEPHIPPFHFSVQFSVVGGGVALAAAGALAAQSFLTSTTAAVVGGGAAAVGGVMMAQEQCLGESVNMMIYLDSNNDNVPGPLYCRATSGQCCELILARRLGRFRCPAVC